ncbi:hypothetical protein [Amycolatopsis sp. NPDC003676]
MDGADARFSSPVAANPPDDTPPDAGQASGLSQPMPARSLSGWQQSRSSCSEWPLRAVHGYRRLRVIPAGNSRREVIDVVRTDVANAYAAAG